VRRWAGVAVAVLAAMALGRVITEKVPVNPTADDPFVRHGVVGRTVELRYADVTVTGIRAARLLEGTDFVAAAGRFLLVDLKLRAHPDATTFLGVELVDAAGRRYAASDRGSACPANTTAPAGVPWFARFCFDVPKRALAGARLKVAKGDYGVNGSGQRRDDQADIDLDIDHERAAQLWADDLTFEGSLPGFDPPPTTPVPNPVPSEEESS
jgi:hypothetical protein